MEANDKKIRVCFISPKAYPLFNPAVEKVFGGAEVDLFLLATELAKDNSFDVSFIVADYGQPDEELHSNVRVLKSVDFSRHPLVGARKIWKTMKQADADWYMLETASPGVPLGLLFSRLHRRRLLYRTASKRECNGAYLKKHPVLGRAFIQSLKRVDRVIVQNLQDCDNLKERYGIASTVLSNGHHIPDISLSEKSGVLWVGRSATVKGPSHFIELAKAMPQETFVMICQQATGDSQYDELKANAARVENLQFIERVPFNEVDRYFETARVFVNTSDSEGFPNTFIQACKAGTAILSLAVNPDHFLTSNQCGFCANGQWNILVNQLKEWAGTETAVTLGQNGRRYALQTHDIKTIIEQYKSVFRECGSESC